MRLLLRAALQNSKHLGLLFCSVAFMLLLSVANLFEMFALAILVNRTPPGLESLGKAGAASPEAAHKSLDMVSHVTAKLSSIFSLSNGLEFTVWMVVFIASFKAIVLFLSRYFSQVTAIRINRDLRLGYFKHIQKLSLSFYSKYDVGALSSRVVADSEQITQSLNSAFTNYILVPFTILTTLSACFFISWKLSMLIFVCLPLVIAPMSFLLRRVKRNSYKFFRNQEGFTSVLIDFLMGIHTIKTFVAEPFSLKKYDEKNTEMARLEAKTAKYALLIRPFLHFVTTAFLASVVFIGLYFFGMTVPELVLFCGALYVFYEPVKKFAEENAVIQKGVVAAERMFEVLNEEPEVKDKEEALDLEVFEKELSFEDVSFRYKKPWILRDLSFCVQKGEMLAIVGATGAGKSTIAQLLPRLYDPQKGEILIDGTSIKDYTQSSLRNIVGYVPQKPFFFIDTVLQNITLGKPHSREKVIEAAKLAQAHGFIENLPDGYDTVLQEGGKNLSGGQMQRLAITRALVKGAPILILDEATSSLDSISENKIKIALENLRGKVTQIVIAHRLTTIENADKILFLENGTRLAYGPLEELLKSCQPFQEMWHMLTSKKMETAAE